MPHDTYYKEYHHMNDSITSRFASYGVDDPNALTDSLVADLGLTREQEEVLRTAIYMAASAYTDQLARQARASNAEARRAVMVAKSAGTKEQVQKAERVAKSARAQYLDSSFYNGTRDVKVGDALVADFEAAIEWVNRHQMAPAQSKIDTYTQHIADIKNAGVKTLRQVKA